MEVREVVVEQRRGLRGTGLELLKRQRQAAWGAKVVERLSRDLREAFPDMKGLSSSNLKYMRAFAEICPDGRIGQQPAKNAVRKSKKSCEFVTASLLKSALPAKKPVRKSKKSWLVTTPS